MCSYSFPLFCSDMNSLEVVYYSLTIASLCPYSTVSQNPPPRFSDIFPKRLGICNQFLHTYYTILSTLDYKFLFNYFQL